MTPAAVGALLAGLTLLGCLAAWWMQRDRARMRELTDGLHNRDRPDAVHDPREDK